MEEYSFSFIFAVTSIVFCVISYIVLVAMVAWMHPGLVFGLLGYIAFILGGVMLIDELDTRKKK